MNLPDPVEQDGLQQSGRLPVTACAFCHSTDSVPALQSVEDYFFASQSGPSDFLRCNNCQSLWQPQILTPELLAAAYASYYTHEEAAMPAGAGGLRGRLRDAYVKVRFGSSTSLVDRALAAIHRRMARNLDQLEARYRFVPPAPAAVLDYGCGNGAYLGQMKALGYEVCGIDFDPTAIATAARSGIEVLTPEDAEARGWSNHFDAITLSHVIEHVPDPTGLLRQLHGWLKPGGTIYVECPNAEATGIDVFGIYWRGLEAPRHLAIPSADGLRKALEGAGFGALKQAVIKHIRPMVWDASVDAVCPSELEVVTARWKQAPSETARNAEYLAIAATKMLT